MTSSTGPKTEKRENDEAESGFEATLGLVVIDVHTTALHHQASPVGASMSGDDARVEFSRKFGSN